MKFLLVASLAESLINKKAKRIEKQCALSPSSLPTPPP